MRDVEPEAVTLMLAYSGLDQTRDEIATNVNATLGTDYTSTDASNVINAVEEEAAASAEPHAVFFKYLLRGVGTAAFASVSTVFSNAVSGK